MKIAYQIFSFLIRLIYQKRIAFKYLRGTQKKIYYQKSQHLNFFFQKKIDYEPEIQSKIRKYINKGALVFDVGGNIGQYALLFSEWLGIEGKVISIEPDPINFSFLQFNSNINFCTNLTCLNMGLGKKHRKMDFYRDSITGGRRSSFRKKYVGNNFKGGVKKVEIQTLSWLIDSYGIPDFVKIDVEGFEAEVIDGLPLNLHTTIFFIEIRKETKYKVFEFFMLHHNYSCFLLDTKKQLKINQADEIPNFANLLFVPNK